MKSHSNRKQTLSIEKGDTKIKGIFKVISTNIYIPGGERRRFIHTIVWQRFVFFSFNKFTTKAMKSGSSKTLLHISSGQVAISVNDICVEEESFSQIFQVHLRKIPTSPNIHWKSYWCLLVQKKHSWVELKQTWGFSGLSHTNEEERFSPKLLYSLLGTKTIIIVYLGTAELWAKC